MKHINFISLLTCYMFFFSINDSKGQVEQLMIESRSPLFLFGSHSQIQTLRDMGVSRIFIKQEGHSNYEAKHGQQELEVCRTESIQNSIICTSQTRYVFNTNGEVKQYFCKDFTGTYSAYLYSDTCYLVIESEDKVYNTIDTLSFHRVKNTVFGKTFTLTFDSTERIIEYVDTKDSSRIEFIYNTTGLCEHVKIWSLNNKKLLVEYLFDYTMFKENEFIPIHWTETPIKEVKVLVKYLSSNHEYKCTYEYFYESEDLPGIIFPTTNLKEYQKALKKHLRNEQRDQGEIREW